MLNGLCWVWGQCLCICCYSCNDFYLAYDFSHSLPFIQLLPPRCWQKQRESMSEQKLTVYIYSCFQVIHVQFSIAWITIHLKKKKGSLFHSSFCLCSIFIRTFLGVQAKLVRKTQDGISWRKQTLLHWHMGWQSSVECLWKSVVMWMFLFLFGIAFLFII